jgi:hypothetical protein
VEKKIVLRQKCAISSSKARTALKKQAKGRKIVSWIGTKDLTIMGVNCKAKNSVHKTTARQQLLSQLG